MDIKLLPCPFCGGKANLNYNEKFYEYYVDCGLEHGSCVAIPSTWPFATKEEAIKAWNTRNGGKE